jgi:pyruvate/2-oxoglutarate dehydrogenase complex dihydrolipoamide dehydrogenase (E3) component
MFMEKACLAESAKVHRQALKIPVMAVGRINDPYTANSIIQSKKADLVCIGRGLLADPDMPKKMKSGDLDDIRICIACNTCMESIFKRNRVECLVNPTLGREKELKIIAAKKIKKIMVVGGGPGGMNIAWIASKRGHVVDLYEKSSSLGGQLLLGSVTYYKKGLQDLIHFLRRQIDKYGVICHFNFQVDVNEIRLKNPDIIVLATGSVPIDPPIKGIDNDIVVSINQIFSDETKPKKRTVIIGGGMTGCEAAIHISENGHKVTVVETLPELCINTESITRKVILQKMEENNVQVLTGYKASRIINDGVFIVGPNGSKSFISSDQVFCAVGNSPEKLLHKQVKSMGIQVYCIGDCLEPRSAKEAISEGAVIGCKL